MMNRIVRIVSAAACLIPAVAYPSIRKVSDGFNQFGGGKPYSGFTAGDVLTFLPFLLILASAIWPVAPMMWTTLVVVIPCFLLVAFLAVTMPPLGIPFLIPCLLFFMHFAKWTKAGNSPTTASTATNEPAAGGSI